MSRNNEQRPEVQFIIWAAAAIVFISIFLYAVNRWVSVELAAALFLLSTTILEAFADSPQEVANGRSLIIFAMPVLVAAA